jgi:hypothetical protein
VILVLVVAFERVGRPEQHSSISLHNKGRDANTSILAEAEAARIEEAVTY